MKLGTIIFVLILIFANVIAPLLKKREEQARKKRQQGSTQSASPAQPSVAPGPPSVSTGSSRMEQLIARRQAQLEELRERREQRRSASSGPQARIGPASAPTTSTLRPTAFRAPVQQPTRPVSRLATARPSAAIRSRPQPAQRRRVSREAVAQPVERKRLVALHTEPAAPSRPKTAVKPFLSLDAQTITPRLLRRLVVLKEIFDPPIALRNRDIWDRPG